MPATRTIFRFTLLSVLTCTLAVAPLFAQMESPSDDIQPLLTVKAGGPQSYITALAFSPDGSFLYAAGWDKVVYVWKRDPLSGQFLLQDDATFRIPIGPGLRGAINAMALSHDGNWLAVAGHGIMRGGGTFRRPGRVLPSEGILTAEMRLDEGMIYVFHTRTREVRTLRGHAGAVVALTFAPGDQATPVLVSAAREWVEPSQGAAAYRGAVRAWDVAHAANSSGYLAGQYLPEPRSRPGLAVRRTGSNLDQLEVGIAWGDQQFRTWDVAANSLNAIQTGRYANTLATVGKRIVGGGFLRTGVVQVRAAGEVEASLPLTGAAGEFLIPRALASGTAAAETGVAVVSRVVTRDTNAPGHFRLHHLELTASGSPQLKAQSRLWKVPDTGAIPAVAISQAQAMIAVAGDSDQSIWLFPWSQMENDDRGPAQVLRNSGTAWTQLAFVKQAEHRGLRLGNRTGQRVFDLQGDVGIVDPAGWATDEPPVADYRGATRSDAEGNILTISRAGNPISEISLDERETVSSYCVITPAGNGERPLLALATHELGQPTLRLFDLESGEPFRQLTGHKQTIHAISVTADGTLLASIAGDQTLCLWDLSDVDMILGNHGLLSGITVENAAPPSGRGSIVRGVAARAASPLPSVLTPGDTILDFTLPERTVSWSGGREFFDAFWNLKPGTVGILRTVGSRGQRSLEVPVGQAIDERKPLLSLFVAAAGDQPQREWIAWTPIGPYEASGRSAERFLGWHFNPDRPQAPVRFAAADEYRETYYREELIEDLLGQGELPAPAPPPPPATSIRFGSDTRSSRGDDGRQVVRTIPDSVHVFVSDFPEQLVEGVTLQVGDEIFANATRLRQDEWQVDLLGLHWPRGRRRFQTVVQTNETPPRKFVSETSVDRIPLSPEIVTDMPPQQTVEQAEWRLTADVRLRDPDQALQTRASLNGVPLELNDHQRIDQRITLQPGDNELQLVASNAGASDESRELESAHRSFRIVYQKAPTPPPQITVIGVETGSPIPIFTPIEDAAVVVTTPQIRALIEVRSAEPLTAFEFRLGEQAERQPVTETAGEANRFSLPLQLQAGKQRLQLFARAVDSDEAVARIQLEYVPRLPKIVLGPGERGILRRDAGDPPAVVEFAGTFEQLESESDFRSQVLLNDEPIGPAEIDLTAGSWRAEIPLRGGENQLRLVISNDWGRTATSETRFIEYQRLPRIVDVRHDDVGSEPYLDFEVTLESPSDRPLTGLAVNGRQVATDAWQLIEERGSTAIWLATIQQQPLLPGRNVLEFVAANSDGVCQQPAQVEVEYDAEFWQPPAVTFLNTAPSSSVVAAEFPLQFRVETASPLRSVQVELNRQLVSTELTRTDFDGGAEFVVTLTLREGVNRIIVRAQNAGGQADGSRRISMVPPPVRVEVAKLVPVTDPDGELKPRFDEDRELVFDRPLSHGYAKLQGVVHWNRATEGSRGRSPELRVWVNGFQQRPIKLTPTRNEASFETLVVLGERKNNRIVLDLAGAASDAQSRLSFSLDCENPRGGQRLHLLTIGVDKQDPASLQARALRAIGAESDTDGQFKRPYRAPGFHRINIYPPLNGKVTFPDVFRLLLDVRSDLLVQTRVTVDGEAVPVNDVVMLYYEGGVLVPERGRFVLSTSEEYDPQVRFSGIASDWLAKFFDSMRGAQLAFIDVAADSRQAVSVDGWSHDSHAALLCYAWSTGSTPPAELRLINAVRKALASVDRLGDLDRILADVSSTSAELAYLRAVSEPMRTLVLRRK